MVRSINAGWFELCKPVDNSADAAEFALIAQALAEAPLSDDERYNLIVDAAAGHGAPTEANLLRRLGITTPRPGHLAIIIAAAASHERLHWEHLQMYMPQAQREVSLTLPGGVHVTITGPAGFPVIGQLNQTPVQLTIPPRPADHTGPADSLSAGSGPYLE